MKECSLFSTPSTAFIVCRLLIHWFFLLLAKVCCCSSLTNSSVLSLYSLAPKFLLCSFCFLSFWWTFHFILVSISWYCYNVFLCSFVALWAPLEQLFWILCHTIFESPFLSGQLLDIYCIPWVKWCFPVLHDPIALCRWLCIWRSSHLFQTLWFW